MTCMSTAPRRLPLVSIEQAAHVLMRAARSGALIFKRRPIIAEGHFCATIPNQRTNATNYIPAHVALTL